jgi:hypothetical protein
MTQAVPLNESSVAHVTAGAGVVADQRPSEQTDGAGDVVIHVGTDDEVVEALRAYAGRTGTRLEMEYESGVRDEGFVAAAAWATNVGRWMDSRVEEVAEVGLALEGTPAVGVVSLHIANGYLGLILAAERLKYEVHFHSGSARHVWRGI